MPNGGNGNASRVLPYSGQLGNSPQWEVLDAVSHDDGSTGVAVLAIRLSIPVPENATSGQTRESGIHTVTRGDCTARVTAHYDVEYLSGGERMVRITGVSGGWEPSLASILVQQREVHAHQGWWLGGDSKHWYPTENSYSYTTGWTKNYSAINTDVWFNEATSYCQVYVPGMGDSYEVNARVVVE